MTYILIDLYYIIIYLNTYIYIIHKTYETLSNLTIRRHLMYHLTG